MPRIFPRGTPPLAWKHESVPFLYTSTGTGPYNPWLDPIVIGEWHQMAYHEINEMAKRGVPGVWTHGFYDGWAPNYMLYIGNGHNAIGRFYETFGNSDPATQDRQVGAQATRDWFRPNPPLARVKWSLRNNVNYQQSALLLALHYSADHREEMLHNFYLKSKRAVQKAATEGPAAYVLPASDPRKGQQAELIRLLQLQGIEVHRAKEEIKVADGTFGAGSFVVRMDQPYSRLADCFLDTEFFNVNDPAPYDDTGWTLGALKNVRTIRVVDGKVLNAPMEMVAGDPIKGGGIVDNSNTMTNGYRFQMILPNRGDASLLTLRMKLRDVKFDATDEPIRMKNEVIPAGSLIASVDGNGSGLRDRLDKACKEVGITGYAVSPSQPLTTRTHPAPAPRIAIVHTWTSTQNEGWWRIGFDQWQIPYDYISVHVVRDTADLRAKWDVIILPCNASSGQSLMSGLSGDKPIPWKKTDETPHLGTPDSSDDIRGGIGEKGKENLKRFVEGGGVFVAATSTVAVARDLGLAPGVSIDSGTNLRAQGGVYNAVVTDTTSPVTYGFDPSLAVYFSSSPLLRIEGESSPSAPGRAGGGEGTAGGQGGRGNRGGGGQGRVPQESQRASGRGTPDDPDILQARPNARRTPDTNKASRLSNSFDHAAIALPEWAKKPNPSTGPRVLLRFAAKENLLVSGMLAGGEALEGRPAVVDVPLGQGHTLLFAINPMWRSETQGSYPLLFNACLHAGALGVGR